MADGAVHVPPGFPRARLPSLHQRVREAVDAVKAVGGTVAAVEIQADGGVRVLTTAGAPTAMPASGNEWDEVLPR